MLSFVNAHEPSEPNRLRGRASTIQQPATKSFWKRVEFCTLSHRPPLQPFNAAIKEGNDGNALYERRVRHDRKLLKKKKDKKQLGMVKKQTGLWVGPLNGRERLEPTYSLATEFASSPVQSKLLTAMRLEAPPVVSNNYQSQDLPETLHY